MATVLKLEHVNFTRAGKPILKDLNWEIQSGENWAVLGLNGAGKTTLLKLLHGDIWPSSGQMEVLGHIFGHSNINDLRKKIGWVSNALQDWLHPGDSAESIVLSGKFASIGVYEETTPAEQATAVDLLKRVGGGSLLGKPYRILSQGEK
ncbi:ATP-binding cassette domain-containing protein, partial [Limosilactobacillus gastricus]